MSLTDRGIRRGGDLFDGGCLRMRLCLERFGPNEQYLCSRTDQCAGVLIAASKRGDRGFDRAIFQSKIADVSDSPAIEPGAQPRRQVPAGVARSEERHGGLVFLNQASNHVQRGKSQIVAEEAVFRARGLARPTL